MRSWKRPPRMLAAGILLTTAFGALSGNPALAQLKPLSVFMTPSINSDAIWMAEANGLFKAEGLDVQIRLFPSGTTAVQTFKTGVGDIMFTGDLPALQFWQSGAPYRVIAPMARDAKGYIGVVKNEIKSPKDLIGKNIATRVGSTGSWFVSEYLTKNGVDENAVKIRNLDPPLMPAALCRGDIDGFFIWEPSPSKAKQICGDKVHYLTTADGYVMGYNVIGARADWLATPEGSDKATRFLRAARKGAELAAADITAVVAYLNKKFGLSDSEIRTQLAIMERVLKFDDKFFADFCSENRWQQRAGFQKGPSDLSQWVWTEGLKSIDPKLVVAAPPPC